MNIRRTFLVSAGYILCFTAAAKLVSALGGARILSADDPVFAISVRQLLVSVGCLEAIIGILCLRKKNETVATSLVAGLSLGIMVYRVGLWLIDWDRPCKCLGVLIDVIGIPTHIADSLMMGVLLFLLCGSSLSMWEQMRESKSTPRETAEIPFNMR